MNKKAFLEAVTELGNQKRLSKEIIKKSIEESFQLSLNKKFEDEYKLDLRASKIKKIDKTKVEEKLESAHIKTVVDLDKAKINIYREFDVLNDDDITDDFVQIPLEEAKKREPNIKVGDVYSEEIDFDTLTKKDVDRFVSNFKQCISKAEKEALLEEFKDKIGTIVTGIVEKFDNTSCLVNLDGTTVVLYRKNLIGDEKFRNGDPIKVYVEGIKRDDKKSALISVSRSCPNFLRKIFENEVNEINDGTVKIVDIARMSGVRSKVVVYSTDPNVDASGACIGKNGERIQRIVGQLGSGHDQKEKIDVILFHRNLGVYLSEILKPGEVIGINFSEDMKNALVICKNDTMKIAVGTRGSNVFLARKLTGLDEIKIINESDMEANGVTSYKPIEEYIEEDKAEEAEEARKRFREQSILKSGAKKLDSTISLDDSLIMDEKLGIDEEIANEPVDVEEEKEEIKNVETSLVNEEKVEEDKKEEIVAAPIKEVVQEEPVEIKEVKTTTTLESLEKSLEEEKKTKTEVKSKKSSKKKDDAKEEKEEAKKPVKKMDIYTEEELKEFEDEDNDDYYDDDEEDWSEYDSDDYYEDK